MALPNSWISAIFKKFQARYGSKWNASIEGIESVAVKEWAEGLHGLSGDEIKLGLEWDGEWPPTLPEFRNACKGKSGGKNGFGLDYVPAYYRERTLEKSRLLSSDERDKNRAKAREHISKLKETLNTAEY